MRRVRGIEMPREKVERDLTVRGGESGVLLCRRHALNAGADYERPHRMTTRKRKEVNDSDSNAIESSLLNHETYGRPNQKALCRISLRAKNGEAR